MRHLSFVIPAAVVAASTSLLSAATQAQVAPHAAPRLWSDKIFAYCERGLSPAFWAEPLNAISNAAFMISALLALMLWQRHRHDLAGAPRRMGVELALVILVAVIGTGSFLFHTYATRWAVVADVVPITIFMIVYLGYVLRRFAGACWLVTLAGLGLFAWTLREADMLRCGPGPCLNGSVGYLPALAVLVGFGSWLAYRRHPAAIYILGGAGVFAVSLTFRTLDRSVCPQTALFAGRVLGTHFVWHVLNATLLYLLVSAAIRHGRARTNAQAQP
jgi:hypothetical protein